MVGPDAVCGWRDGLGLGVPCGPLDLLIATLGLGYMVVALAL
jgi:hypothetical protein